MRDSNSSDSDSLDQREVNLIEFVVTASLLRGSIRCKHSTSYACGYEIRPIIWFSKKTKAIVESLEGLGLEWKSVFVRTEEITKICHAYRKFFSASPHENSLKTVDHFNGLLPQPQTYDEVEEVLEMLDKHSESLIPPTLSDKSHEE